MLIVPHRLCAAVAAAASPISGACPARRKRLRLEPLRSPVLFGSLPADLTMNVDVLRANRLDSALVGTEAIECPAGLLLDRWPRLDALATLPATLSPFALPLRCASPHTRQVAGTRLLRPSLVRLADWALGAYPLRPLESLPASPAEGSHYLTGSLRHAACAATSSGRASRSASTTSRTDTPRFYFVSAISLKKPRCQPSRAVWRRFQADGLGDYRWDMLSDCPRICSSETRRHTYCRSSQFVG